MQEILKRMQKILPDEKRQHASSVEDEKKIRENYRQRIVSDNIDILNEATQNLLDCNLGADECAESFNRCKQNIIEEAEKKLASAILSEKTDYPITLGRFKSWEELTGAEELSVSEKILEYLNSSECPLTTEEVVRQLQAVPVKVAVTGKYVYEILFFLREHNLEPASLEDLFVFSVTYKNLKKYAEFRKMYFYSFGFRLDQGVPAATTKDDKEMQIFLTTLKSDTSFYEGTSFILAYPAIPTDSRPRRH